MAAWVSIDNAVPEIKEEPWSMYWSEQKSTSPEFARFLKEPLAVLRDELPGVQSDWRISTEVINHNVGFMSDLVCKVAFVFPLEKLVKVVMYKHPVGA